MGIYVNPDNSGFAEINDPDYVDKTMLIEQINWTVGRKNKLTCICRPRRFGKSYAAKMLAAYYSCSCDSHELFDDKEIASSEDYEKHINQYNVICLDITGFISEVKRKRESLRLVPDRIVEAILNELSIARGQVGLHDGLIRFVEETGKKIIFVIDEWDAMIREAKEDVVAQEAYLNLLRGWFKNTNFTPRVVAAAYMTGILPIKKDGSQSAISDFKEYSMIKPRQYGSFVGFTEEEVKKLCVKKHIDFETMKFWYDGYSFLGVGSVYNPNSVMQAIENNDFDSYWTETSAAEGLMDYISKDYNGMTKTVAELVGGVEVKVDTTGFSNDLVTFKGRDDVLTLMIHLGYLAYDAEKKTVSIPNEEIKLEFARSIHEVKHEATLKRLEESERLFVDTIQKNERAVAAQIEKVHAEETAPLHYNKEDSLRSVIKLAYYSYRDHYIQFEELPAGEGYADVVYLPRADSDWPALVVELKWNQDAQGAIDQILQRKYPSVLENLGCKILLVGISYNKDASSREKKHSCRIVEG
ncbi:MAG: AAA family ATPase [Lachnospiraceae bacterium]|nr:AAA family ATPase [Lachnospiraceae bacterium]